jgi:hypothetical protein
VNDAVITAEKVGAEGSPVYLLSFDTSLLCESASSFEVSSDGQVLYQGGLHSFSYINENLYKYSQVAISYTMDNWVALNDPNLYVYLTAENHELTVNDETFLATWDEDTSTFILEPAEIAPPPGPETGTPASGDFDGDGHTTAAEALLLARAVIDNTASSAFSEAQTDAMDMDRDGVLTMADALLVIRKAMGITS